MSDAVDAVPRALANITRVKCIITQMDFDSNVTAIVIKPLYKGYDRTIELVYRKYRMHYDCIAVPSKF